MARFLDRGGGPKFGVGGIFSCKFFSLFYWYYGTNIHFSHITTLNVLLDAITSQLEKYFEDGPGRTGRAFFYKSFDALQPSKMPSNWRCLEASDVPTFSRSPSISGSQNPTRSMNGVIYSRICGGRRGGEFFSNRVEK